MAQHSLSGTWFGVVVLGTEAGIWVKLEQGFTRCLPGLLRPRPKEAPIRGLASYMLGPPLGLTPPTPGARHPLGPWGSEKHGVVGG